MPDPEELDDPRSHHRMDGGQQRRHLRHAALEDLRRGPRRRHQTLRRRAVQRGHPQGPHRDDVRFTTKGDTLYAFVMGIPAKQAVIPSLALGGPQSVGKIRNVELLGAGKLTYTQTSSALTIQLPNQLPTDHAIAFKITGV